MEIDLAKLVLYQPSQLQLTNAVFFLTTAMIVDGTVSTRTSVKAGNVAMTTPTTAIIQYTAFIQLVSMRSKGDVI